MSRPWPEISQQSDAKVSETVVVLRAVELLRVSLMELSTFHPLRGDARRCRGCFGSGFLERSGRFSPPP